MQLYHMETRHPDLRTTTTTTTTIETIKPLQGISALKRKDGYDSDLYQQKGVKRPKEEEPGEGEDGSTTTATATNIATPRKRDYARTHVNADDELWQILSALKEESRTPGVIPRLEPQFTSLNRKGNTVAAYLCSPYTDHIATGFMDLGWGCGYRNCQMLMTFLQRKQEAGDYILRQVADISGLQLLLEKAWNEGFDAQGAKQLSNRVYKTRKWIGTTEVYCMLVYLGVRCTILDFHRPSGPNNTHDAMFDWIQSYFESAAPTQQQDENENNNDSNSNNNTRKRKIVHITDRPPLYLQHSGHSRTVIGIELLKDGKRNLIMFDPGRRMLRSYRSRTEPEDDIDESAISSSQNGDSDDSDLSIDDKPTTTTPSSSSSSSPKSSSFASRLLTTWKPRTHLPANLLRPFRVDAKAIAKNKQYQLLVLGEVKDERAQGGYLSWNSGKGYLLDEHERESMKDVTSMGAL